MNESRTSSPFDHMSKIYKEIILFSCESFITTTSIHNGRNVSTVSSNKVKPLARCIDL